MSAPDPSAGNVLQLRRKENAPPLFVDGNEATELEPYEQPIEGKVVDDPATVATAGGWMADRRAFLDAAPAVIPSWLKRKQEFADNARFVARYYSRQAAFYALRTPVYWARLAGQGPRGAKRLSGRWWRWVTDAESRPVVASAAGGKDGDAWTRVANLQSQRTSKRWKKTGAAAVPAALLLTLAAVFLPGWQLALAAAGISTLLGLAGGRADTPIVKRYVSVHLQRRLESNELESALEAIGIKGRIDFVNPIATDGPGWRAELDLPGANLAESVLEKRAELAAAMRRPLSTVWPETDRNAHPGRLVLWVAKEDPARAKRRIWPLMHEGQADLFTEIPYGFDPRGRLVTLRLMYANGLIGGVMGSGKTSAVLVIVLSAALDPSAELWMYELKGSGDLESVRPICHRYISGDDDEDCKAALDGMRALEREMKRRKALIKNLPASEVPEGRKVYKHLADRRDLGLHPILAVFDEAHTLFEHDEYGKPAAEVAGRLIRKARAYGIIVIFTTQRPDTGSIPKKLTDNAILRICLAVTGQVANDMVLGTGMHKRGIKATMFDAERDAGTGWLARSALNTQIVRAAFINQGEALAVAQRALALRIAAGTLSGQAAGEAIEELDDTDLLDDLRAVWPAGEETMHSHPLVEALAVYRPDRYGAWMDTEKPPLEMSEDELRDVRSNRSTMLSAALKPYGVMTRQINKRGAGGSAKGLRWDDLPAASEDDEDGSDED